jgi:hypothetical protein
MLLMNKPIVHGLWWQLLVQVLFFSTVVAAEPDRAALQRELWATPSLRTAGVLQAPRTDPTGAGGAAAIVDRSREAEQRTALARLLARRHGAGVGLDKVYSVPVSELLDKLQQKISDDQLQGCGLAGILLDFPSPDSEALELVIYGEISSRDNVRELAKICDDLLQQDDAWRQLPAPVQVLFLPARQGEFARDEFHRNALTHLQDAVRDQPALHGCWVDFLPAYDREGELVRNYATLWLDASRADAQRAEVDRLFQTWAEGEVRPLRERLLPLSELVSEVREALNEEFEIPGNWVLGAYFARIAGAGTGVELRPFGRIGMVGEPDGMSLKVTQAFESRIKANPAWRGLNITPVDRLIELHGALGTTTPANVPGTPADDDPTAEPPAPEGDEPSAGPAVPAGGTDGAAEATKTETERLQAIESKTVENRGFVRDRMREDEALHGAWIDMGACVDHRARLSHYDVYLWLDQRNAELQKARIEEILRRSDAKFEIVQEVEWPFSELIARLQETVQRDDYREPGCWISGGYFQEVDDANRAELVLYGRVLNELNFPDGSVHNAEEQGDRIVGRCTSLMRESAVWRDSPKLTITPVPRGLKEHKLSEKALDLRGRMQEELWRDPQLHGCWVDLAACYDWNGNEVRYDVYLWVDQPSGRGTAGQGSPGNRTEDSGPVAPGTSPEPAGADAPASPSPTAAIGPQDRGRPDVVFTAAVRGSGPCFCIPVRPPGLATAGAVRVPPADPGAARVPPAIPGAAPLAAEPEDGELFRAEGQGSFGNGGGGDAADAADAADAGDSVLVNPEQAPVEIDQRTKLIELLNRFLGEDKYTIVAEAEVPVSDLVNEVRREVEAEFGRGCFVLGAYFAQFDSGVAAEPAAPTDPAEPPSSPDSRQGDGHVELHIYGQGASPAQITRIEDIVQRAMRRNPIWERLPRLGGGEVVATDRILQLAAGLKKPDEVTEALRQVRAAVKDDPLLHGAWVDLTACYDHFAVGPSRDAATGTAPKPSSYLVYLWLDEGLPTSGDSFASGSNRADLQRQEIMRLLETALGAERCRIADEVRLPVSQMLADLRRKTAEQYGHGCFVRGGYFEAPPALVGEEQVELMLFGRAFDGQPEGTADAAEQPDRPKGQRETIREMAEQLRSNNPGFNRLCGARPVEFQISVDGVKAYQPSAELTAMRETVRNAIGADERLKGVWLDLAECRDHRGQVDHYEVYVALDAGSPPVEVQVQPAPQPAAPAEPQYETRSRVWVDRCGCPHQIEYQVPVPQPVTRPEPRLAGSTPVNVSPGEQEQAVFDLLDQVAGPGRYAVVERVELPFTQLVARLQDEVVQRFGAGCYVSGASYVEEAGSPAVDFVLEGQVFTQEQRDEIARECERLKRGHPGWTHLPGPQRRELYVRSERQQLLRVLDTLDSETDAKRRAIRAAILHDPRLHGAWVDVADCRNRDGKLMHYDVCVWLDTQRAGAQQPAVWDLLDQWLGQGRYHIVRQTNLPLSGLLAELQRRVAARYGPGCFATGAYYAQPDESPPSDPVELTLYGRVADDEMRQWIQSEGQQILAQDAAWNGRVSFWNNDVVVVDKELKLQKLTERGKQQLTRIHQLLYERRLLRGIWVDVDECYDHLDQLTHYNVYVHRDEAFGESQKQQLRGVLDEVLGSQYVVLREEQLPVADMLSRVNLVIDAQTRFSGSLVQGIHFTMTEAPDGPGVRRELNVFGRIAHEEQRVLLRDVVESYLHRDHQWQNRRPEFDLVLNGLQVVVPDSLRGADMFSHGVEHYRNGRYALASEAFQLAMADSPNFFEYRYWRVLAEIGQGRMTEAYHAMLAATIRRPSPSEYQRIHRSLEKVQGSARVALMDLENRARSEFHLYALSH